MKAQYRSTTPVRRRSSHPDQAKKVNDASDHQPAQAERGLHQENKTLLTRHLKRRRLRMKRSFQSRWLMILNELIRNIAVAIVAAWTVGLLLAFVVSSQSKGVQPQILFGRLRRGPTKL
jgi:hypothetical protein